MKIDVAEENFDSALEWAKKNCSDCLGYIKNTSKIYFINNVTQIIHSFYFDNDNDMDAIAFKLKFGL